MKLASKLSGLLMILGSSFSYAQVYMTEGFESGSKPVGWTEQGVVGDEPWRFRNGGHSPNDNNWLVPADEEDITRNPSSAFAGTYNAIFFKQGDGNERTMLITPEMDLLGGVNVELSFYLCQIPWTFEGSSGWDILRVYYKTSEEGQWVLLHEYLDPIYEWEKQVLYLPDPNETYYVAFEGQTRWGYGTCVDEIIIQETGSQPLYVSEINFEQPFEEFIPSGTSNIPILRMDVKVVGNTDAVSLDEITITSQNTSDADIETAGVKLYATVLQNFNTNNPVGSATSFSNGEARFTNINHELPRGLSYLWLTYDIDANAGHENVLDVMIQANDISAGGANFPSADVYPNGGRTVYETMYNQDFEGAHGWALTGEFEVATPNGNGGSPGNPNPSEAAKGTKILGTDLTGLGSNPYNYEPSLNEASSYRAESPRLNALYYKNLNIFYQRYMNIEVWDNAFIEVSTDNGGSWDAVWESSSYLSDFQYMHEQIQIPDEYSRTSELKFRFRLGPTDGTNNYSGWSIDDLYLTGEFISKDVGVSEWIAPQSGTGHSDRDSVKVRISNYGGADITDPVPVAFSLDGGASWTINHMNQDIPVGGSVVYTFASTGDFSSPGEYTSIQAKTFLPGDQFTGNDKIGTSIYVIPTYEPPHTENFENNNGYWRRSGLNLWEYGRPTGNIIYGAASGDYAWGTGVSAAYGDIIADQGEVLFADDFESEEGWSFSGEFERNTPSFTNIPYFSYSGFYCIGTDLSGQGSSPYLYENGITEGSAYRATSPAIDVHEYSNLSLSFARWLEIEEGDSVKIEISDDNGSNWHVLWRNSEGAISDQDFVYLYYEIPEEFSYATEFRFRFSLFNSSASGTVNAGLNIDDILLSGDYVHLEGAELKSTAYDMTGMEYPVLEVMTWYETEEGRDGANLSYSIDDGNTWNLVDNINSYDGFWNWYTGNTVSVLGSDGFTGSSGQWIRVRHLLPDLLKDEANVQFKFRFLSDKSNNTFDGLMIDDFTISEAPDDIGIDAILSPATSCILGENETFGIRVRNHGFTNISAGDSITLAYSLDHDGIILNEEETYIFEGALLSGNTLDIQLNTAFDLSDKGTYEVEIHIVEEDPFYYSLVANDTAFTSIQVNKAILDLGPDISTAEPDTIMLDAYIGEAVSSYLWQDLSSDRYFDVDDEGLYYVTVTNSYGCSVSDSIEVKELITDLSVSSVDSPLSDCELGEFEDISITVSNSGSDVVPASSLLTMGVLIDGNMIFESQRSLSEAFYPGESFQHTFSGSYNFSHQGIYNLEAYVIMDDDHVRENDTLDVILQVYGYPNISLGSDTTVLAASYTLEPGTGYASYLWQDGSTEENFTISEAGTGTYSVTVVDEHGCASQDEVLITLNTADVSLFNLLSPISSCELSNSIIVSAEIRNEGSQVIPIGEEITLAYSMNGGSIERENIVLSQPLAPGGLVVITFSESENVSTGQWYDFEIFTEYLNDARPENDTIYKRIGVFDAPVVDLGEDYQVVTQSSYTLDAGTGFSSYLWQDESTNQTYTISNPGIGTYSVLVTDDHGCQAFDEVRIFLAIPDIGVSEIKGPNTACSLSENEHVELIIENYGNFPIESSTDLMVAYSINGGDEVEELINLSGTFEAGDTLHYTFATGEDLSSAGSYELLVYTVLDGDQSPGNDIKFKNFTVLGSPVVDIGNGSDTLEIKEPLTLAVDMGYASYEWHDGSNLNEFIIATPQSGSYKVKVTGDNGCITSDSVFVIYDIPDLGLNEILFDEILCSTGTLTPVSVEIQNNGFFQLRSSDTITVAYSLNGTNSVFERKSFNPPLFPGETTTLTFTQGADMSVTGNYYISVSLIFNRDSDFSNNLVSTNLSVFESPLIDIGNGKDTLYTDSYPLTLDAGSGYLQYLWQDESTASSYTVQEDGTYWVEVSNEHGCMTADTVFVRKGNAIELNLEGSPYIQLYPNPVSDRLHVDLSFKKALKINLKLYSLDGKMLYQEDISHLSFTSKVIDLKALMPGSYILQLTAGNERYYHKIIKE